MSRYTLDTQAREFLNHLHRGGTYGYYWTIDEVKTYVDRGGVEQKCKSTVWFAAGAPPALPQGDTSHIYFGVNPTTERGGAGQRAKNTTIAAINCLFAEFDAKDYAGGMVEAQAHVEALSPMPSVIVNSGGGFHAYWLLHTPYAVTDDNRTKVANLQYRWVKWVGGDDVKDLARVLRVPGTRNVKAKYAPDYPSVEFVKCDLNCQYDLGELAAYLPREEAKPAPRTTPQDGRRASTYNGDNPAGRYIETAVADVEAAGDGQLHYAVRAAACRLGRVVGARLLSESEAETLLINAIGGRARDIGRAVDTIRSGLQLGQSSPFVVKPYIASGRRDPNVMVRGRTARDPSVMVRGRTA